MRAMLLEQKLKFWPSLVLTLLSVPIVWTLSELELVEEHRPLYFFDQKAADYCFPNAAQLNGEKNCTSSLDRSKTPIYYQIIHKDNKTAICYWVFFAYQKTCDCCSGNHDTDWEHVCVNLITSETEKTKSMHSVTFFQHNGWFTNCDDLHKPRPHVFFGKIGHGSYDRQCSWKLWNPLGNPEHCAGGCGYWEDNRGFDESVIPVWNIGKENLVHHKELSGVAAYETDNSPKHRGVFVDSDCEGSSLRLVTTSGCWLQEEDCSFYP